MNNVRHLNRQAVLEAIFSRESTSRKELCSITGLSASTVGLIVNDLLEKGVLFESGAAASDRGRKPIAICLDPAFVNVLAVDADELSANIYDVNGKALLAPTQIELEGRPGPEDVVRLVKERLATLPKGMKHPGVIGVSVPGSVNSLSGEVQFSSNLGWRSVPLGSLVSRETNIPTIVESNMVCLTLTEAWFGTSSNSSSLAYIHAGWRGVGGGLVFNGEIYRGANSNGAEIGHMQADPAGAPCTCGKAGCVETIASGKATLERARQQLSQHGKENADHLSWSELIKRAADGDNICRTALEETARTLGRVAVSLVLLLDPAALVLGGRVMEAQHIVMPVIRAMLREQVLSPSAENLTLGVTTDSKEKSMAGAARIAGRSYLFSLP